MSPATEFERGSHTHDADDVTVFLGEERHGAERESLLIGQLTGGDLVVGQNKVVELALDGPERREIDRSVMRKVKPEPVRLYQRSLLPNMTTQAFPQYVMD